MKCPECKTDGAYQPLMRQLECENASCSFYMKPKVHYAVHSVESKKIVPIDLAILRGKLQSFSQFPDKNGDIWAKYNPCNEITLAGIRPKGKPIRPKSKYPLDSLKVVDIRQDNNSLTNRKTMTITLTGWFDSWEDMEEAQVALQEVLRKRTASEIRKIEDDEVPF